ncbi:hypothetical protein D5_00025 [Salmonella phage D5lw]|nr:hypothetical protein D5_00025 [Salmonella phage D5lw]
MTEAPSGAYFELKEGLKFELHKDERTDVVTMRFTVYTNDI